MNNKRLVRSVKIYFEWSQQHLSLNQKVAYKNYKEKYKTLFKKPKTNQQNTVNKIT